MPCKISDHSDQFGLGPHPPPWGMGWRCFQAFLKAASHASLPLCMMWKNMIKYLLLVCTRLYSHSVSLLVSRLVGQSVHPKSMKSSQISTKRLFQRWIPTFFYTLLPRLPLVGWSIHPLDGRSVTRFFLLEENEIKKAKNDQGTFRKV